MEKIGDSGLLGQESELDPEGEEDTDATEGKHIYHHFKRGAHSSFTPYAYQSAVLVCCVSRRKRSVLKFI